MGAKITINLGSLTEAARESRGTWFENEGKYTVLAEVTYRGKKYLPHGGEPVVEPPVYSLRLNPDGTFQVIPYPEGEHGTAG